MSGCFCPSCGFDLRAVTPVVDGPYRYALDEGFSVDGRRLAAPRQVHELLGAVMLARGRFVRRETLLSRLGSEGTGDVVSVQLSRARRALRAAGHLAPIETVPRVGVRWAGAGA